MAEEIKESFDEKTQKLLDEHFPLLPPLELAVAINACKDAGAVNAVIALGKYITRLELEVERLTRLVSTFNEMKS